MGLVHLSPTPPPTGSADEALALQSARVNFLRAAGMGFDAVVEAVRILLRASQSSTAEIPDNQGTQDLPPTGGEAAKKYVAARLRQAGLL